MIVFTDVETPPPPPKRKCRAKPNGLPPAVPCWPGWSRNSSRREDLQTTREGGKTQLIVLAIEDIMGGPRTQRSDETEEVRP